MGQDAAEDVCVRIAHQHLRAAYADASGKVVAHECPDHVHIAMGEINQAENSIDHRIAERDQSVDRAQRDAVN